MLRIASLLQIIFGVAYFFLARLLLGKGEVDLGNLSGEWALLTLLIAYGGCAFQLLAGLIGLVLANKKSFVTVLLGILLFIPVLANFLTTEGDIITILITAVTLVFPYLYLHGAWKNFKG